MLDSEYARRAVGEVSVPFGICREPSNVAAAGRACPFRFRCIGCDHFRADASYLPELTAYLDDLLRTRERLTAALAASEQGPGMAAGGIDRWAAADAMPSAEEITRLRALIGRITASLDAMPTAGRAAVDEAVAVARRHRTVMLGTPGLPVPGLPASPPHRPASPGRVLCPSTGRDQWPDQRPAGFAPPLPLPAARGRECCTPPGPPPRRSAARSRAPAPPDRRLPGWDRPDPRTLVIICGGAEVPRCA
jgi:hypothetical protein